MVEKLRKIEKFLKIFKKAEVDTTRKKTYFWQNKNQQNAGISGCGGKTRTYDLLVMSIIFHGKEFAIARTTIGGAGTAGIAEELIAMGAKKY